MVEGPVHWERASGLGVQASTRRQAEQQANEQQSFMASAPASASSEFLSWCHPSWQILSLKCKPNKPLCSPSCFWSRCFIMATVHLTKTVIIQISRESMWTYAWAEWSPEVGTGSPEAGITGAWKLPSIVLWTKSVLWKSSPCKSRAFSLVPSSKLLIRKKAFNKEVQQLPQTDQG